MKILVMSDSHGTVAYARRAVELLRPDAMVHLGDHYADAQALAEAYPRIPLYCVPGNCDANRCPPEARSWLCCDVGGVRLFMAHGHEQWVKFTTARLEKQAASMNAQAALYGHTHLPDRKQGDRMWIFNPGACGSREGTVGLIVTDGGKILDCRHIALNSLLASEGNV